MKQSTLGAILAGNIITLPVLSFLNYKLRVYYGFYNFEKILIILFSVTAILVGLYLIFSKNREETGNTKSVINGFKLRQIMGIEIAVVSVWYAMSFNNFGISFVSWYLSCFVIGAVLLSMKNQDLVLFRNYR